MCIYICIYARWHLPCVESNGFQGDGLISSEGGNTSYFFLVTELLSGKRKVKRARESERAKANECSRRDRAGRWKLNELDRTLIINSHAKLIFSRRRDKRLIVTVYAVILTLHEL